MLTMMAAAIIAPSLPNIALEFHGFPQVELLSKLVLSIPALMIAIIAPFAGGVIDRFGRLKLLYLGLIGFALSGTSGYFLNDLYLLLFSRVILGISLGIIMTTAMTLVGDYFEGEARQKFIGYQSAFIGSAGVLFMIIGGFLATLDWRVPFLVYLFSLLLLPLCYFFLKEPNSVSTPTLNEKPSSNKLLSVLFLMGTLYMIIFYLFPTQLPFLLKSIGVSYPSFAGDALAVNALGIVFSSFFYSKIKTKLSFQWVAWISLIMMGIGCFGTGISGGFLTVLITVFVAGLGLGLFIANLSLWVLELSSPQIRGKNMGILTACLFFGQFISPIVAEPIVKASDLAFLFMSSIFVIGLMGIILWAAIRFIKA